MSQTQEKKNERIILRANAFINDETNEEDEQIFTDSCLRRFEKAIGAGNQAEINKTYAVLQNQIKGTRISVSLSEEDMHTVNTFADMMKTVFMAFPALSVPRDHSHEAFVEKLTLAMKEQYKNGEVVSVRDDDE